MPNQLSNIERKELQALRKFAYELTRQQSLSQWLVQFNMIQTTLEEATNEGNEKDSTLSLSACFDYRYSLDCLATALSGIYETKNDIESKKARQIMSGDQWVELVTFRDDKEK